MYTAAMLARLIGTAYDDDDAFISFQPTVVDSIGRGSAERWSGADFAISATIRDGRREIRKAILAQAKLGSFEELPAREQTRLLDQVKNMRRLTRSPKVMVVPTINGRRQPRMLSGVRLSENRKSVGHTLPDYFVARVLTTLDGDTRPSFVDGVQDGTLADLRVFAELRGQGLPLVVPSRVKVYS